MDESESTPKGFLFSCSAERRDLSLYQVIEIVVEDHEEVSNVSCGHSILER